MAYVKNIAILGSTGSIGTNTLDVVRSNRSLFNVVALSAGRNIAKLKEQIAEFKPDLVSILSDEDLDEVRSFIVDNGYTTEVDTGEVGAIRVATHRGTDTVVSAIVGAAGLVPTIMAIKAGKNIALSNKESLVIAGKLVMEEAGKNDIILLPIDSEHNAIYQCLQGHSKDDAKRLILTASGGPFLKRPLDEFKDITPEEALNHPTWDMGQRITIDSATLMNKGFEVIEAKWLFGFEPDEIDVIVHPQSIVHSMVEFKDGSILSQMGVSDMRGPISYTLGHPMRLQNNAPFLDLNGKSLEFYEVDNKRYPCLELCYRALNEGMTMPAVLNGADEILVDLFLHEHIGFTDIPLIMEKIMDAHSPQTIRNVDDVLDADRWARAKASEFAKEFSKGIK